MNAQTGAIKARRSGSATITVSYNKPGGGTLTANCTIKVTQPLADGVYTIQNKGSGNYLDVQSASSNVNKKGTVNVIAYQSTGGQNQQWIVRHQVDGYYKIHTCYPFEKRKALNVTGTNVDVDDAGYLSSASADRFLFSLTKNSDGSYKIARKSDSSVITQSSSSTGVSVAADSENTRQNWAFSTLTLEKMFTKINTNSQGAAVKFKVSGNNITIDVKVRFNSNDATLLATNCDNGRTIRQNLLDGIRAWGRTYSGDTAPCGITSKITVNVAEDKTNGFLIDVRANSDDSGSLAWTTHNLPWKTADPVIQMQFKLGIGYYRDSITNRYIGNNIILVMAHEFGHVLGLDDAYTYADGIERSDPATCSTLNVMQSAWIFYEITCYNIQMLLYAWNDSEWQYWKTFSGNTQSLGISMWR